MNTLLSMVQFLFAIVHLLFLTTYVFFLFSINFAMAMTTYNQGLFCEKRSLTAMSSDLHVHSM